MDIKPIGKNLRPRDFGMLKFSGNEAYGNTYWGVRTYVLNDRARAGISTLENTVLWHNNHGGFSVRGNKAVITGAFTFGNMRADVVFNGNDNALRNSRILGELPNVVSSEALLKTSPSTLRGVLIQGERNVVDGTLITDHVSTNGATAVDLMISQDEERLTTVFVSNSMLGSKRPVVLGYPPHELSYILLRNTQTQNRMMSEVLLYRIDAGSSQLPCAGASSLDSYFVATRCDVSSTIEPFIKGANSPR
jgi:hypothetical protein